jgi:hypothetical protein
MEINVAPALEPVPNAISKWHLLLMGDSIGSEAGATKVCLAFASILITL